MLPMLLARLLVTLLVADAALVGPSGAAPTTTFADYQEAHGLRTVESVEKTCPYEGLHGGAPHDGYAAGSPLTTRGTTSASHRVPPTAEGATKEIADIKTMPYKTTNEMAPTCCAGASAAAGQDPPPPPNAGACRVCTSADAAATNADTEAKAPIKATTTIAQHPGPGVPPDTLAPACPRVASAPRHLHTNDQVLPPEDSATTNNTAKNVGQGGCTLLPSARDNVGKDDEVSLVRGWSVEQSVRLLVADAPLPPLTLALPPYYPPSFTTSCPSLWTDHQEPLRRDRGRRGKLLE